MKVINESIIFKNDNKTIYLGRIEKIQSGYFVERYPVLVFEHTPNSEIMEPTTWVFSFHPLLIDFFQRYGSKLSVVPSGSQNKRRKWNIQQYYDGHLHANYFWPHYVAYGIYHGHITSVDSFETEYEAFRKLKEEAGLYIDHLDSIWTNNTVYNLSLMTASDNGRKNNITAKINYEPHNIAAAYVDHKYRVTDQVAGEIQKHSKTWQEIKKYCQMFGLDISASEASVQKNSSIVDDATMLNELLRSIGERTYSWLSIKSPLYHKDRQTMRWHMSDTKSALADIFESVYAQHLLASQPEEYFIHWPKDVE